MGSGPRFGDTSLCHAIVTPHHPHPPGSRTRCFRSRSGRTAVMPHPPDRSLSLYDRTLELDNARTCRTASVASDRCRDVQCPRKIAAARAIRPTAPNTSGVPASRAVSVSPGISSSGTALTGQCTRAQDTPAQMTCSTCYRCRLPVRQNGQRKRHQPEQHSSKHTVPRVS